MYVLQRGERHYFNRRIDGKILRLSLFTDDKDLAKERAANLYILTNRCLRKSMDYSAIKQHARAKAERMHQDWLEEHFTGLTVSDEAAEQQEEDIGEQESTYSLRRKLILGELLPDEVEDSLASLLFYALKSKSLEEWRNPELILNEPVLATPVSQQCTDRFSDHIDAFLKDKQAAKC